MRRVATLVMAMTLAVPAASALPTDAGAGGNGNALDVAKHHARGTYRLRVHSYEPALKAIVGQSTVRRISFDRFMSTKPGALSRCGSTCRRWPDKLKHSATWYPQGLTGSKESRWDHVAGRREIVVSSWYKRRSASDHTSVASSLKFISTRSWRFRSIPLRVPVQTGSGWTTEPLQTHAGGAAWAGRFIYVAGTDRLYRFDLRQIFRSGSGPFLLPDRRYLAVDKKPYGAARLSSVSTDWSGKPSLVTARYHVDDVTAEVVRWPLTSGGGLASRRGAVPSRYNFWIDKDSAIDNVQGVESHRGTYLFSNSGGDGDLDRARVGTQRRRKTFDWNGGLTPQDLDAAVGHRVYGQTEARHGRRVFWRSFSSIF